VRLDAHPFSKNKEPYTLPQLFTLAQSPAWGNSKGFNHMALIDSKSKKKFDISKDFFN
jgi:hypothetical protein